VEELEPIESTHACVALTFRERPCVDGVTLPTLAAEVAEGANAAT